MGAFSKKHTNGDVLVEKLYLKVKKIAVEEKSLSSVAKLWTQNRDVYKYYH